VLYEPPAATAGRELNPGIVPKLEAMVATASPAWAADVTGQLHRALPHARVAELPGQRHVAMDTAPELFGAAVVRFLTGPDDSR
jgi:pimeloyl-ACP methyl ester carboxylesterase